MILRRILVYGTTFALGQSLPNGSTSCSTCEASGLNCYSPACPDTNSNCFNLTDDIDDVCYQCPEGFYTTDQIECTPCAGNKDCSASVTQCPTGEWSPEGQAACEECPKNFICDGVAFPKYCELSAGLIEENNVCIKCPEGKRCSIKAGQETVQTDCSNGFYSAAGDAGCYQFVRGNKYDSNYNSIGSCATDELWDSSAGKPECVPCPNDYLCDGTDITYQCSLGTYLEDNACKLCPSGSSCDGMSSPSSCGDEYALEADGECNAVPNGHELNGLGLSICADGSYNGDNSPGCKTCEIGFYCRSPSENPESCPSGYYSDVPGLYECLKCPPGSSCSNDGVTTCIPPEYSPEGASECLSCPSGHICPNADGTENRLCEPGYYTDDSLTCIICPEGSMCPISYPKIDCICNDDACSYAPSGSTHCFICPAGKSCDSKGILETCGPGDYSVTGQKDCFTCPDGYFCPSTGIAPVHCAMGFQSTGDRLSCEPCPEGYSCDGSGTKVACGGGEYSIVGWMDCRTCPVGYACPDKESIESCDDGAYSNSGDLSCHRCPAGKYCLYQTDPIDCPAGFYCPDGSVFPEPCDLGTYNTNERSASSGDCIKCQPGYYCSIATSVLSDGNSCPRGHYCQEGSSFPRKCPAGTHNNQLKGTSAHACKACEAGFYCPVGTSDSGKICPAGSFCPASTSDDNILSCSAGTFSEEAGTSENECKDCPKGHYCCNGIKDDDPNVIICNGGVGSPLPCPPGFYQDEVGKSTCKVCPDGKVCSKSRLIEPDVYCNEGHVCEGGVNYPYSWGPVATWHAETSPAVASPEGEYIDSTNTVKSCPLGHYCFISSSGGIRKPTRCPSGYFCDGYSSLDGLSWTSSPSFQDYNPPADYGPPTDTEIRIRDVNNNFLQGTTSWNQFGPKQCLPGTWSNLTMLESADACSSCPPGWKCTFGTNVVNTGDVRPIYSLDLAKPNQVNTNYFKSVFLRPGQVNAALCDVGCYCPMRTGFGFQPVFANLYTMQEIVDIFNNILSVEVTYPQACPAGTYNDVLGVTRLGDCKTCTSGHYCDGNGAISDVYKTGTVNPSQCPAGTYNPEIGSSQLTECLQCEGGYKCPTAGMSAMIVCGISKYSAPGYSGEECPDCLPGYYCDEDATSEDNMKDNKVCPPGTNCDSDVGPIGEIPELVQNACPLGYYCLSGDEAFKPIACPAGTYGAEMGLTSQRADPNDGNVRFCTPCPAGKYCPNYANSSPNCAITVDGTSSDEYYDPNDYPCKEYVDCQPGHYCKTGSFEMDKCPVGFYQPFENQVGEDACAACISGYYCDEPALPLPIKCPVGYYCLAFDGTVNNDGTNFPCPPGTYSNSENLRTITECPPCEAGKYCPDEPTLLPLDCDAGYYCIVGAAQGNAIGCTDGTNGDRACAIECPLGAYCPSGSFTPQSCPEGTYTPSEGSTSSSDCNDCQPGYFCSGEITRLNDMNTYQGMSGICETGYYCPGGSIRSTGLTTNLPKNECTAGRQCPRKSASEVACLAGFFQSYDKAGECYPCTPGKYCPGEATSEPSTCEKGQYCDYDEVVGTVVPSSCAAGYFLNTSALWEDELEYDETKMGAFDETDCKLCPLGYVCSEQPSNEPLTQDTIELCPETNYCEAGIGQKVDAGHCPVGFYCPTGTGDKYENPCELGYYQNTLGRSECLPCEPGYVCPSLAMTTSTDVQCPEKYFCPGKSCLIVPTKEIDYDNSYDWLNARCEDNIFQCTAGYQCPLGSSGPKKCSAGTYTDRPLMKSCMPCKAGYYCPGDSSSDYDSCVTDSSNIYCVFKCPAGHYCPENSTEPKECGRGTYNKFEYGSSEDYCVPCPAGKFCDTTGLSNLDGKDIENGYFAVSGATSSQPTSDGVRKGPCMEGYQCSAGAVRPEPCSEGTYSASGSSICPACSVGKHCPKRGTKLSELDQHICVDGYQCGGGCKSPRPYDESDTCNACSKGSYCADGVETPCGSTLYQPNVGSWSCMTCPGRYYCNLPTGTSEPEACPAGYYCPEGTGDYLQFACPDNTFNSYTKMFLRDECLTCPPGLVCDGPKNEYPTHLCSSGQYCPGGSQAKTCSQNSFCPNGQITETECPTGTLCNGADSMAPCTAGNFCHEGSSETCPTGGYCTSGSTRPIPCGRESDGGLFSSDPTATGGDSEASYCSSCNGESYCPGDGYSYNCKDGFICGENTKYPSDLCQEGYICIDGKEQNCPNGQYQPGKGQTVCKACPNSLDCYVENSVSEIDLCPAGNICNETGRSKCPEGTYRSLLAGQSESTDCFDCPYGSYCSEQGLSEPTTCDDGYECDSGSSEMNKPCPDNYYCMEGKKYSCPAGEHVPSSGTDAIDQNVCSLCPIGYYCPGDSKQELCDDGYHCQEGSIVVVEKCSVGNYCQSGKPEQTLCQPGSKSISVGQSECESCTAGYYCPAGSDETPCPVGHYCEAGASEGDQNICPSTYFSDILKLKSEDQCQYCPRGSYCTNGQKSPCSAGNNCPNGTPDNTNSDCGAGSECSRGYAKFCARGLYKAEAGNSDCSSCPIGSYCETAGLTQPTDICADGYFCTTGATRKNPVDEDNFGYCKPGSFCLAGIEESCAIGSFQDQSMQSLCPKCPKGYLCDTTGIENYNDKACGAGHYCDEGTVTAEPCPAGFYRDKPGARSVGECHYCESGYICSEGTSSLANLCPAGYYCLVGGQPDSVDDNVARPSENHEDARVQISDRGNTGLTVDICPEGFFCPEGSSKPSPCPTGYYCPTKGLQTATKVCSAGFFCKSQSSVSECENDCDETIEKCPIGFYCPAGVDIPVMCPDGSYGSTVGLTESTGATGCSICQAGYFCWQGQTTGDENECPTQYYCPEATSNPYKIEDQKLSLICPKGHYCQEGEKRLCEPGEYQYLLGQSYCQNCPEGYYCSNNDETGQSEAAFGTINPIECTTGHYCPSKTSSKTQFACPPGTLGLRSSIKSSSECSICPPGDVCADEASSLPLPNCSSGYLCYGAIDANGATSVLSSVMCPLGSYCPSGTQSAIECPQGFYQAEYGQNICKPCPEDYYCPFTGTIVPSRCPAGYFCPTTESDIADEITEINTLKQGSGTRTFYDFPCPVRYACPEGMLVSSMSPCEDGTYTDLPKQTVCKVCPNGKICQNGAVASSCALGKYCNQGLSYACPAGTYNPNPGQELDAGSCDNAENLDECAVTQSLCLRCPKGHICTGTSGGSITAVDCQASFYCQLLGSDSSLSYSQCPLGSYCPAATATPIKCPFGTYRSNVGGASIDDCTQCDPGKYCDGSDPSKISGDCQEGYYCKVGAYESRPAIINGTDFGYCKEGEYCPKGANAALSCTAGTFNNREYQASCTSCLAGYICEGGTAYLEKCPKGYICLGNNAGVDEVDGPIKCGTEPYLHTWNPSEYGKKTEHCQVCPAGHLCVDSILIDCSPGLYCTEGVSTACEEGFVCTGGSSEQVECPYGFTCPQVSTSTPTICPSGKYCKQGSTEGTVCGSGYYCNSSEAYKLACNPGFYSTGEEEDNEDTCLDCEAGFYCPTYATSSLNSDRETTDGYITLKGARHSAEEKCPVGSYCVGGIQSACTGSFQPIESSAECLACGDGYTCSTSSTRTDCPIGSYCNSNEQFDCPAGTFGFFDKQSEDITCNFCPPGTICKSAGLIFGDILPCGDGFMCEEGSQANSSPCPTGAYCQYVDDDEFGDVHIHDCPVGTYRDIMQGSSEADCQNCGTGKYCPYSGMVADGPTCAAGYYCDSEEQIQSNPSDKICSTGSYCNGDEEIDCPEGTFRDITGGKTIEDCFPCPAGKICESTGLDLSLDNLVDCPENNYCDGYDPANAKQSCPEHHICPSNSYMPFVCTDGTYQSVDVNGKNVCVPCDAGTKCYNSYIAESSSITILKESCDPGYFCETSTGRIGHACPTGKYNSETGQKDSSACLDCTAGDYCSGSAQSATSGPCVVGHYCSGGTNTPVPSTSDNSGGICRPGYVCREGSGAEENCESGYYQPNYKTNECKICPAGFNCGIDNLVTDGPISSIQDKLCPIGHYCPEGTGISANGNAASVPHPCDSGTFSLSEGITSQTECIRCPAGKFCIQGSSFNNADDLENCAAGHYCSGASSTKYPVQSGCTLVPSPSCTGDSSTSCWDNDSVDVDEIGGICKPGFYCPEGSARPIPCKAGNYCSSYMLTAEEGSGKCIEGHYCPIGSSSGSKHPCPPGHYCPEGTAVPVPCPPGTYTSHSSDTLRVNENFCIKMTSLLPSGSAYEGYGNTDQTYVTCEAGWYCPSGSKSRFETICSTNHFCQTNISLPSKCPDGKWQPLRGQEACTDCPKGYICNNEEFGNNNETPLPCPLGYYCVDGTVAKCPPGSFGAKEKLDSQDLCTQCPGGKYCIGGMSEPSGDCNAGFYCGGGASSAGDDSVGTAIFSEYGGYFDGNDRCPKGHYCPKGSIQPVPCQPGTYSDKTGHSHPSQCEGVGDAYYIGVEAAVSPCGKEYCEVDETAPKCDDGFVCIGHAVSPRPDDDYEGGHVCAAGNSCNDGLSTGCLAGNYQSAVGQTQCLECPPGYECSARVGIPTICDGGTFCTSGSPTATLCDIGTFSEVSGASEIWFCNDCLPGMYCDEPGLVIGKSCPLGRFCPPNMSSSPISSEDYLCPAGHICDGGRSYGEPCPFGSFSDTTGNEAPEACKECTPGMFCPEKGMKDVAGRCYKGYYCTGGNVDDKPSANVCESGYECPHGSADQTVCSDGNYIPLEQSEACVTCPSGYFCAELTYNFLMLKQDNGFPDKTICPSNHYCTAGSTDPIICQDGTTTTAGATGLVKSSDCKPCPTGHFCNNGEVKGKCKAGYFCLAGSSSASPNGFEFDDLGLILSNETMCTTTQSCAGLCPPGHYCKDEGTLQPLPCEENMYIDSTTWLGFSRGANSKNDCNECKKGEWCQPAVSEPTSCPIGFYCEANSSPAPCPTNSFRNEPGAKDDTECSVCEAGYYCTILGMTDPQDFACKPGFYCPGGDSSPVKCPGGSYRTLPGGKCGDPDNCITLSTRQNALNFDTDGCLPCEVGYYCSEQDEAGDQSNDYGLPCPPGIDCSAASSNRTVLCPEGHYCPETSSYVNYPCYAGDYCPESSWNTTICEFPYYCTPQTGNPFTCDLGYGAVESMDCRNRTSEEACCIRCPSGQYRSDKFQMECEPCPVGYYCPEGTGLDPSEPIPCPLGHYCPEGNPEGKPIPCPPGTFSAEEFSSTDTCVPCPTNTFNNLYGQESCRVCSAFSTSSAGASECTCLGSHRSFQYSDGKCICETGYIYYSLEESDESSENLEPSCLEIVNQDCSSNQVRDSLTRECILEENADCPFTVCPNDDMIFNSDLGICFCAVNTVPEEIEGCCRTEVATYDNENGILYIDNQPVSGILGPDESYSETSEVFRVDFNLDGIFGLLPLELSSKRKRRNADYQYISNPSLCLLEGEMVIFNIEINMGARNKSSYPKYEGSNLFNSNPNFDFGEFRKLEDIILNSAEVDFDQFGFVFTDSGNYAFVNSIDPRNLILIHVAVRGTFCSGYRIQPQSELQLSRMGVRTLTDIHYPPHLETIVTITVLVILINLGLLILTLLWVPQDKGLSPVEYWKPSYLAVDKIYVPPTLTAKEVVHNLEDIEPDENKVKEVITSKVLYDHMENQNLLIASQIRQHKMDLDKYFHQMTTQTNKLYDIIDKVQESQENIKSADMSDSSSRKTEEHGLKSDNTNIKPTLFSYVREEDKLLMVGIQKLLNKLNGGSLQITDEMVGAVHNLANMDATPVNDTIKPSLQKSKASRIERDLIEQEIDEISSALRDSSNREFGVELGRISSENMDAIMAEYNARQEQLRLDSDRKKVDELAKLKSRLSEKRAHRLSEANLGNDLNNIPTEFEQADALRNVNTTADLVEKELANCQLSKAEQELAEMEEEARKEKEQMKAQFFQMLEEQLKPEKMDKFYQDINDQLDQVNTDFDLMKGNLRNRVSEKYVEKANRVADEENSDHEKEFQQLKSDLDEKNELKYFLGHINNNELADLSSLYTSAMEKYGMTGTIGKLGGAKSAELKRDQNEQAQKLLELECKRRVLAKLKSDVTDGANDMVEFSDGLFKTTANEDTVIDKSATDLEKEQKAAQDDILTNELREKAKLENEVDEKTRRALNELKYKQKLEKESRSLTPEELRLLSANHLEQLRNLEKEHDLFKKKQMVELASRLKHLRERKLNILADEQDQETGEKLELEKGGKKSTTELTMENLALANLSEKQNLTDVASVFGSEYITDGHVEASKLRHNSQKTAIGVDPTRASKVSDDKSNVKFNTTAEEYDDLLSDNGNHMPRNKLEKMLVPTATINKNKQDSNQTSYNLDDKTAESQKKAAILSGEEVEKALAESELNQYLNTVKTHFNLSYNDEKLVAGSPAVPLGDLNGEEMINYKFCLNIVELLEKQWKQNCDLVVVPGAASSGEGLNFERDLNVEGDEMFMARRILSAGTGEMILALSYGYAQQVAKKDGTSILDAFYRIQITISNGLFMALTSHKSTLSSAKPQLD